MIKRGKKAQTVFGLSYGAIFSILIIIFIIAVAFIAIKHFLGLNQCTQVGFLYQDLEDEITRAWSSGPGRYSDEFTHSVDGNVEYVCFGHLADPPNTANSFNSMIQSNLTNYQYYDSSHNVYLYPPAEACEGDLFSYDLKCGSRDSNCLATPQDLFFCVPVQNKQIKLRLEKTTSDSRVTVQPI